jgi:hypothetical protein
VALPNAFLKPMLDLHLAMRQIPWAHLAVWKRTNGLPSETWQILVILTTNIPHAVGNRAKVSSIGWRSNTKLPWIDPPVCWLVHGMTTSMK